MGFKKYLYNDKVYMSRNKEFLARRLFGNRGTGHVFRIAEAKAVLKKVPWDYVHKPTKKSKASRRN